MKDIDFDELDRAVNSLINPNAESTSPSESTSPAATTDAPVLQSPTAPSQPLAERRSSGRFMDVVHPSSDMRGSVAPRPAMTEPNQPSMTTPLMPVEPKPEEPASGPGPELTAPETIEASDETQANDTTEPLESPFLADAKVEKRPLGAFSSEVHDSSPSISATMPATTEPDEAASSLDSPLQMTAKSEDHPIEKDTPLPAELQTDVLSIEANEDSEVAKAEEATAAPIADPVPVGPTSITPQYTQQPSTGDKPAGNIFDTQAYKKPQAKSGKKSGLFVVLWIFLLLVVGAGIGAAVYFFVLPRL